MSWLSVAAFGVIGGAIPEVLRYISALRAGCVVSKEQLLASTLTALLGMGVLMFDNTNSSRLQVAVLGAAFPSLFSGMVSSLTSGREASRSATSIVDYLSWRF